MKKAEFTSVGSGFTAVIAAVLTLFLFDTSLQAQDRALEKTVQPFFQQHCIRCHGPDREEGGLRIDQLTTDLNDLGSVDHLQNILDELTTDSMPPEDEPQPSEDDLDSVCRILTRFLAKAKEKHSSGGGKPLRRLSRTEYVNTVYDLLGVHVVASKLPADRSVGSFDTDADALYLTDLHFESYLEASRDAVRRFIASRNEEPGTKKVNTKLAQGIKQGKAQVYTNQVPSAGHLIVRLSCWQRNPNPNRRTFITVESNSYEVTGTSSDAQQIDLEFHEAKDLVDLKYGNAEGNKKGRALSKSQQKMKVTRQNLLDVQDLVVKHPIVLGDIQNFAVVSPQPFEFFKTRFGSEGNQPKDSSAKVILRDFVKLISRGREPDRQFVNKLNEIFLQGRKQREPFWEAIVEPMAISMCSIEFLMHFENKGESGNNKTVSGVDFANRLSYFLWRSAPDEQLMALGKTEELLDPLVKAQQVERMMNDPKFERFLADFSDQWLELQRQEEIAVDKRLFPDFKDQLRDSMREETVQFVSLVIRENLSITKLIDSEFMVLNNDTADHYGVEGVSGDQFRVVKRGPNDKHRGGILTHAGILMQTSTGERTSIVERGVFVARKLLDSEPPPPPPNVAQLDTENEDFARMTGAELVRRHASSRQCSSCHNQIDPLGLGLEQYDVVGRFRTVEKRIDPRFFKLPKKARQNRSPFLEVPLETRGKIDNKRSFEGIDGLKKALLSNKDRLSDSYVGALLYFANGRKVGVADKAIVDDITERASKVNFPARSIIKAVVYSRAFSSN